MLNIKCKQLEIKKIFSKGLSKLIFVQLSTSYHVLESRVSVESRTPGLLILFLLLAANAYLYFYPLLLKCRQLTLSVVGLGSSAIEIVSISLIPSIFLIDPSLLFLFLFHIYFSSSLSSPAAIKAGEDLNTSIACVTTKSLTNQPNPGQQLGHENQMWLCNPIPNSHYNQLLQISLTVLKNQSMAASSLYSSFTSITWNPHGCHHHHKTLTLVGVSFIREEFHFHLALVSKTRRSKRSQVGAVASLGGLLGGIFKGNDTGEATRQQYAAIVNFINGSELEIFVVLDLELRDKTFALRERVQQGETLDSLLPVSLNFLNLFIYFARMKFLL